MNFFCRARADTFMQIRPVSSAREVYDRFDSSGRYELTFRVAVCEGISAGMPCTSSWQSDDYAKRMTVRARVTRHATLATLTRVKRFPAKMPALLGARVVIPLWRPDLGRVTEILYFCSPISWTDCNEINSLLYLIEFLYLYRVADNTFPFISRINCRQKQWMNVNLKI